MFTERVAIDLSEHSKKFKSVIGYELEVITPGAFDSLKVGLSMKCIAYAWGLLCFM